VLGARGPPSSARRPSPSRPRRASSSRCSARRWPGVVHQAVRALLENGALRQAW